MSRARGLGACMALLLLSAATPRPLPAQQQADAEAGQDPRCMTLFEQAVGQLAAEQYPKMRKVAQDRMLVCPDPVSAFLLGLAEANLVDALLVGDRGQREQMRRSALRHLRVAAAGEGALEPQWQMTTHEWIVHLSRQSGGGAAVDVVDDGDGEPVDSEEWLQGEQRSGELEIAVAPPPQPQPRFPWGPVVSLVLGAGALSTGIALGLGADAKSDDAKRAARELHALRDADAVERAQLAEWARKTQRQQEAAEREAAWATGLMIGGGAALAVAGIWYWLLPPEGHWRWAATPTGVQMTVRF